MALASAQTAQADELRAPQNVSVDPVTRQSSELASRAATAAINGQPQQALQLANQAIRADPRNPWPYYDKGMALAKLGEIDGAIAALYAAQQHFAPTDRWGKSIAIYGRAHALSQAGRCVEAVEAFAEYATFVSKNDPQAAEMARRYAANCRSPAPPAPAPAPPQSEPGR
jgi:tetratricopeptide (TPR) repeat protein